MTADLDSALDDVRPRSWAEAFPWLAGVSGPGHDHRWDQTIDEVDAVERRSRLATISELALRRLTRWSIGQIFPGLSPNLNLLQLRMPARASNALQRFDCTISSQLMSITLEEMMDWRQVGVGTLNTILEALADASTSVATPIITHHDRPSQTSAAASFDSAPTPEWVRPLVDDLKLVSTWFVTAGLRDQLLFGPVPPGTPEEVIRARQRLETLRPGNILDEGETQRDVASWLNDALCRLDSRAVQILGARLFADEPFTLDHLGRVHDVTRERVRQIEGKARGSLLSLISEHGPLVNVASSVRDTIGTIRPLDDLLDLFPALAREITQVGQPAWRVLDRLDDAYEIEDGWCVVPTLTSAKSVTHAILQERADEYGVARIDRLDLVEVSRAERIPTVTASWLAQCGYVIHGEFVFTRTSSVGDYAAAILALEGAPLSAQEIVERFVFERSVGSTRNAMGTDDRFVRVDRDRWALKEWGLESYSGIRSVIRELVGRGGGRARLTDIVEHITARYSVSSNSVIAYAAAAPFMTKDGVVKLAAERVSRKTPRQTRRLFRRSGGWAYRVRLTTDHLRGSGSVAPMAVATILNVQAGQTVQLDSRLGPQAVAWTGIQPSFGTIRRFLIAQDASAGSDAFLVLSDNRIFDFELAREPVGNPLVDALSLIGARPTLDRDEARSSLATAIGLPSDAPISSVIGDYTMRGDDDVAGMLIAVREYLEVGDAPAGRDHRAAVNEILDLL